MTAGNSSLQLWRRDGHFSVSPTAASVPLSGDAVDVSVARSRYSSEGQ